MIRKFTSNISSFQINANLYDETKDIIQSIIF